MKICLTCAAGGHLDELMIISKAFDNHEKLFVTVKEETTIQLKTQYKTHYIRDWPKPLNYDFLNKIFLFFYYIYITIPCFIILIKEKPDVILGCGGQGTINLCYIGKIMGCEIIYFESLARIFDISLTGRLVYPITDLYLVQWEQLAKKYKKAKYWGQII